MSIGEEDPDTKPGNEVSNSLFRMQFEPDDYRLTVLRDAKKHGQQSAEDLANYLRLQSLREQRIIRLVLVWMLIIVPAALLVLAIIFGVILNSLIPH